MSLDRAGVATSLLTTPHSKLASIGTDFVSIGPRLTMPTSDDHDLLEKVREPVPCSGESKRYLRIGRLLATSTHHATRSRRRYLDERDAARRSRR